MCLLKGITGLVPENPFAVNVLNKSSQHREKWKFLLSIPISIFKVFISCVLGFILLILTKKRQLRIEKICRQKINLTTTTTATTIATTTTNYLLRYRKPVIPEKPISSITSGISKGSWRMEGVLRSWVSQGVSGVPGFLVSRDWVLLFHHAVFDLVSKCILFHHVSKI